MKKLMISILAFSMFTGFLTTDANAKKVKKQEKSQQTLEIQNTQDVLNQEFKMPTDEEIKSVLQQFNFDEKQQEYLFKETKKKFEEMEEQSKQK